MRFAAAGRGRRGLAMLAVATIGSSMLVGFAQQPSSAAGTDPVVASPRQSLVVSNAPTEIDGVPTFGPNTPVEIMGGFLPVWTCPDIARNDPLPVVIANSTIKVKKEPDGGAGATTDTRIAALGGLNLGTTVGVTGPSGPLTTGTYDVVYDECQDGEDFSAGFDARFGSAFRVIVPITAPVIDLGQSKADAKELSDRVNLATDAWSKYSKLDSISQARTGPTSAVRGAATLQNFNESAKYLSYLGTPNLIGQFLNNWSNVVGAYANDPPDAAFAQVTTVDGAVLGDHAAAGGTDDAIAATVAAVDRSTRLNRALLHAVERYQGAREAKDGHWSLVHAREIRAFATALSTESTDLGATLRATAGTYRSMPPLDPATLAELRAAASGLSDAQIQALRNAGYSAADVTRLRANVAAADLDVTAADVAGRLTALAATADAYASSLLGTATRAATAAAGLAADPNVGGIPPTAQAGGPYSAVAGGTFTVDGSGSTGGVAPLTYRWDTDGDGQFDDATGARTDVPAGAAGRRLVGLRVTDAIGQVTTAYTALVVTGPALRISGTPDVDAIGVDLGSTTTFTAGGGSPVEWRLDGAVVGTGAEFRYAPATVADAGIHQLVARVGAAGAARLWTVVTSAPDADADGWTANVDCEDRNAAVNPGRTEVVGDGLDNDCDPVTSDGQSTGDNATVTASPLAGGGFETAPAGSLICGTVPGSPTGWTAYSQAGSATAVTTPAGSAHSGSQGLLVDVTTPSGSCGAAGAYQDLTGVTTETSFDLDYWVRPEAGSQFAGVLFGWDHTLGAVSQISARMSADRTVLTAYGQTATLPALTAGAWHHLVISSDAAAHVVTLRVDGAVAGRTPAGSAPPASTGAAVYLGQDSGSPAAASRFSYDDARLTVTSDLPYLLVAPTTRGADRGETFVDLTVDVTTPRNDLVLASTADGTGLLSVDDGMDITVTRADGSVHTRSIDFSHGCSGSLEYTTLPLDGLLAPGRNTVRLALRDICGSVLGNTPIWLTSPSGTTVQYATPTVPPLALNTTAGQPVDTALAASVRSGSAGTFQVTAAPQHGTAVITGGRLTYQPAPGFVGVDTLAYAVTAGSATSAPGTVRVTVAPAPGAPRITPIADLAVTTTAVERDVSASAPGSSRLTLTAAGLPDFAEFTDLGGGHGVLRVDNTRARPGAYTVTVTAESENGRTTAPVIIRVAGNRPPTVTAAKASTPAGTAVTVPVRATDPDGDTLTYAVRTPPAHGTATGSGPAFTYRPASGYSGPDAFTVAVSDGTATSTLAVTITVTHTDPATPATPTTPPTSPASPVPPVSPSVDSLVTVDVARHRGPTITPTLRTSECDDLLVAFVGVDGAPGHTPSVTKVSGGGLRWTRVRQVRNRWGAVEIWQARAGTTVTGRVTVNVTGAPYDASVSVVAFADAARITDTSAGTAATSRRAAVSLAVPPGSLVWATGHDRAPSLRVAAGPGQKLAHVYRPADRHATFWTQRGPTPAPGTRRVTVSTTGDRTGNWQLTAVAITPRPAPTG